MTDSAGERRLEYLRLPDVHGADINVKTHDLAGLRRSIAEFGYTEPGLLDERTGKLVAGHGRLADLHERRNAGAPPPPGIGVDTDGEWLVPVVRGWASASDAHARAYLAASNKLSENGGWDLTVLPDYLADLDAGGLLELTGFTDAELAALLDTGDDDAAGAGGDRDAVPDTPDDPVSVPGDLWLLGRHRLLVGDALDPAHVDRVLHGLDAPGIVYTDPPYGISIVAGSTVGAAAAFGGKKNRNADNSNVIAASTYRPVAGDGNTDAAASAFRLLHTAYPAARQVWWGANHYAGAAALPDASCWLVWDKDNSGNFADAELAWTNHRGAVRLLRHMWNGMLRASERGKRVHPTQKPVALAEWAFGVIDPEAKRRTVLDVFAGSGSTLIAAHITDRDAAAIEMEPAYVDVICRRFQQATGIVPVREESGEACSFLTDE